MNSIIDENVKYTDPHNLVEDINNANLGLLIEGAEKVVRDSLVALKKAEDTSSSAIDNMYYRAKNAFTNIDVKKTQEDILRGETTRLSTIIKWALATGFAWVINPVIGILSGIMMWKRENKLTERERERLIVKLKNEVDIVNEKIRDAESDSDKKKKYQYMRLKQKLDATITALMRGEKADAYTN